MTTTYILNLDGLTSYDSTLLVPTELTVVADDSGATTYTAVYGPDTADVSYDDLGALLDAHALDPDTYPVALDELLRLADLANRGKADAVHACLDAACDGRLWNVDTQSAGEDCLFVADSAVAALGTVAERYAGERLADETWPEYAARRRWTAERETLPRLLPRLIRARR